MAGCENERAVGAQAAANPAVGFEQMLSMAALLKTPDCASPVPAAIAAKGAALRGSDSASADKSTPAAPLLCTRSHVSRVSGDGRLSHDAAASPDTPEIRSQSAEGASTKGGHDQPRQIDPPRRAERLEQRPPRTTRTRNAPRLELPRPLSRNIRGRVDPNTASVAGAMPPIATPHTPRATASSAEVGALTAGIPEGCEKQPEDHDVSWPGASHNGAAKSSEDATAASDLLQPDRPELPANGLAAAQPLPARDGPDSSQAVEETEAQRASWVGDVPVAGWGLGSAAAQPAADPTVPLRDHTAAGSDTATPRDHLRAASFPESIAPSAPVDVDSASEKATPSTEHLAAGHGAPGTAEPDDWPMANSFLELTAQVAPAVDGESRKATPAQATSPIPAIVAAVSEKAAPVAVLAGRIAPRASGPSPAATAAPVTAAPPEIRPTSARAAQWNPSASPAGPQAIAGNKRREQDSHPSRPASDQDADDAGEPQAQNSAISPTLAPAPGLQASLNASGPAADSAGIGTSVAQLAGSQAPSQPDETAPAGSGHPVPESAAAAQAMPALMPSAHHLERMGQTELRVGVTTSAFGNVEVRTAVADNHVAASVVTGHSELRAAMVAEMPSLQQAMEQHHLRLDRFELNAQAGNGNDRGATADQQAKPQAGPRPDLPPARDGEPAEPPLPVATAGAARINVHA